MKKDQAQTNQNPNSNAQPSQSSNSNEPAAPQAPKKKRTGLIISIIVAILVLLGGGGAFAAFAIIKNTPESIFSDSMGHLMSANQIAANGDLNITSESFEALGINSIKLDFDTELAQSDQQANASLQINFTGDTPAKVFKLGEVKLQNGVFYLRIENFNEHYQQLIRPIITEYIENIYESYYINDIYEYCYFTVSYSDCVEDATGPHSYNHMFNTAIKEQSAKLLSKINQVAEKIDNQWFEFSLEKILDSDFFTKQIALPASFKQSVISSYNCSVNAANQITNYKDEFSNLYNQNPFINLASGQDGYYNVSLNADNLANYVNNIFSLNFYKDLAKCNSIELPTDSYHVTAEDIEKNLDYLPSIALRFDGFFDHHLTGIKINQSNDYYNLSANINLTYPTNLQISAPTDSRPIMDLVQEFYDTIFSAFEE